MTGFLRRLLGGRSSSGRESDIAKGATMRMPTQLHAGLAADPLFYGHDVNSVVGEVRLASCMRPSRAYVAELV